MCSSRAEKLYRYMLALRSCVTYSFSCVIKRRSLCTAFCKASGPELLHSCKTWRIDSSCWRTAPPAVWRRWWAKEMLRQRWKLKSTSIRLCLTTRNKSNYQNSKQICLCSYIFIQFCFLQFGIIWFTRIVNCLLNTTYSILNNFTVLNF